MARILILNLVFIFFYHSILISNIYAQNFHDHFSNDSSMLSDNIKKILSDPCLLPYKNKKILLPDSLLNHMKLDLKNDDISESWKPMKLEYWFVYHWTNDEFFIKKLLRVKNNSRKKIKILKEFMLKKKYDFGSDLALPSLYVSHDFYTSSSYGKYLLKLKIQAPSDNHLLYMDYDELIQKFSKDMAIVNQGSCEMAESRKNTTKALWLMAFEDNKMDYFIYSGKKNDNSGFAQIINENIVEAVDVFTFHKNGDYLLDKSIKNHEVEKFLSSMSEEEILYYLSMKSSHFKFIYSRRLDLKNILDTKNSKEYSKFLLKVKKVIMSIDIQNLSPECIVLKNKFSTNEFAKNNRLSNEDNENDFYKTYFDYTGLCSQILNF